MDNLSAEKLRKFQTQLFDCVVDNIRWIEEDIEFKFGEGEDLEITTADGSTCGVPDVGTKDSIETQQHDGSDGNLSNNIMEGDIPGTLGECDMDEIERRLQLWSTIYFHPGLPDRMSEWVHDPEMYSKFKSCVPEIRSTFNEDAKEWIRESTDFIYQLKQSTDALTVIKVFKAWLSRLKDYIEAIDQMIISSAPTPTNVVAKKQKKRGRKVGPNSEKDDAILNLWTKAKGIRVKMRDFLQDCKDTGALPKAMTLKQLKTLLNTAERRRERGKKKP